MRRVMVQETGARIILGGNAEPRLDDKPGYGGRYPGVVEEAWRSLVARQPTYVVGGFGGAAAFVAELLEDRPIPERLKDATWLTHDEFRDRAERIDNDVYRQQLGLPRSMDDLGQAVKDASLPLLSSDDASMRWNGLTVRENEQLLWSRDPLVITSLVMRGLLNVNLTANSDKLQIELVRGSVTEASELDAIAVATFTGIPLAGAGAAIDEVIGGLATVGRSEGRSLINVSAMSEVDSNWIYLASLGAPEGAEKMDDRIFRAAEQTAAEVQRLGLRRLGIVAYGGNVISDLKTVVKSMLDGLEGLRGFGSVSWFETGEERFDDLHRILSADDRVKLTTRHIHAPLGAVKRVPEALAIHVEYSNEDLMITLLPPSGNAMASKQQRRVTAAEVDQFAVGSGHEKRSSPDLDTITARGRKLAKLIMGDDADELINRTAESRVVIIHDVPSSRFPFETMNAASTGGTPAAASGMNRRLVVRGVPIDQLFSRPPKTHNFNLLLVINPTGDLKGAIAEGEAVEAILQHQENISLKVLREQQATKAAVLQELPTSDVLHYCGHAFFDGPGDTESGLCLADNETLTLADIRDASIDMPRVAFVNACEAGRVRGLNVTNKAASFAEFFLRSGVEAYLGTFWRVGDSAAQEFSREVYSHLASGKTLDESVTQGRKKLKDQPDRDWANYILYGDGRFQLIRHR